ncbi:MAG: TIGR02147 family protein [Chitinispirillaceae bacterium]|nr:TIGR02147 family protein [Chitinispirillaceae bacterium]
MENVLPNIFEYIDFKQYLVDLYKAKRSIEPGFTHAYVCHKLGQPNSRSFFNNIISGRKKLTSSFVELLIRIFNLGTVESKFFRALVNYNQASGADEKEFYFDQIVQLNQTPCTLIDKDTYEYYKKWYHSTIRSLLAIIDFKNDYKSLAGKLCPAITSKQARESIALLKRLGMVESDADGCLRPVDKVLSTGQSSHDDILRHYQVQCLELGKQAVLNDENQPCHTTTHTVFVSDIGYRRILNRLEQCRSEIRSIIHKDEAPSTRVYQVNLQLFPKTKAAGKP